MGCPKLQTHEAATVKVRTDVDTSNSKQLPLKAVSIHRTLARDIFTLRRICKQVM